MPWCCLSAAVAYDNASEFKGLSKVVVVVCGGATSTVDQIREWAKKYV